MKDYRFLVYPEKHKKMNAFIIMNMLKLGMSVVDIMKEAKSKKNTIEDI